MRVHLLGNRFPFPLFVKCLESLPNLHTLEMGWVNHSRTTTLFQSALKGVTISQIKTLILPPAGYPLLQRCPDVEDVACIVGYKEGPTDKFLKSLASNRHSKVKRLAIPLVLRADSSRKQLNTPLYGRWAVMDDWLHPQGLRLRAQGSPNSPSSPLIHIAPLKE